MPRTSFFLGHGPQDECMRPISHPSGYVRIWYTYGTFIEVLMWLLFEINWTPICEWCVCIYARVTLHNNKEKKDMSYEEIGSCANFF